MTIELAREGLLEKESRSSNIQFLINTEKPIDLFPKN